MPSEGQTSPRYERQGAKYSYVKSPRYGGKAAQVGPLSIMINDRDPLVLDLAKQLGASAFTRELARLGEAVRTFAQLKVWLDQLDPAKPFYKKPSVESPTKAVGIGLTEAGRGALGHWVCVEDGKIKNYQVITPTAWNASPKDSAGNRGAIEEAVVGTPVPDETNPVEVQHAIRSFDPCLSCAVHIVTGDKSFRLRVI